jgi:hypothetical protein
MLRSFFYHGLVGLEVTNRRVMNEWISRISGLTTVNPALNFRGTKGALEHLQDIKKGRKSFLFLPFLSR